MLAANLSALWSATDSVTYEPEAQALFARMTTPPSTAYKAAINTLIQTGKSAGWWQKFDAFWMPKKAQDSQAGALNWTSSSFTLTASGTITHSAAGFASTGSPNYMDTGFIPTTHGVNFTLNDARIAALADYDSGQGVMGAVAPGGAIYVNASQFYGNLHGATEVVFLSSPNVNLAEGLFSISRRGSTEVEAYKDGVSVSTLSQTSTGMATTSLLAFAKHQGSGGAVADPWAGTIGHMAIGGGFTDAEEASFKAARDAYDAAL